MYAGNDIPLVSRWTGNAGVTWDIWQKCVVFDAVRALRRRAAHGQRPGQFPAADSGAHHGRRAHSAANIENFSGRLAVQNMFNVQLLRLRHRQFRQRSAATTPIRWPGRTYHGARPARTFKSRAGAADRSRPVREFARFRPVQIPEGDHADVADRLRRISPRRAGAARFRRRRHPRCHRGGAQSLSGGRHGGRQAVARSRLATGRAEKRREFRGAVAGAAAGLEGGEGRNHLGRRRRVRRHRGEPPLCRPRRPRRRSAHHRRFEWSCSSRNS